MPALQMCVSQQDVLHRVARVYLYDRAAPVIHETTLANAMSQHEKMYGLAHRLVPQQARGQDSNDTHFRNAYALPR